MKKPNINLAAKKYNKMCYQMHTLCEDPSIHYGNGARSMLKYIEHLEAEHKELLEYHEYTKQQSEHENKELIDILIIEVTKEADKLYPNPHGADIRKAIAFVDGGNYILNQLKTNKS